MRGRAARGVSPFVYLGGEDQRRQALFVARIDDGARLEQDLHDVAVALLDGVVQRRRTCVRHAKFRVFCLRAVNQNTALFPGPAGPFVSSDVAQ